MRSLLKEYENTFVVVAIPKPFFILLIIMHSRCRNLLSMSMRIYLAKKLAILSNNTGKKDTHSTALQSSFEVINKVICLFFSKILRSTIAL